MIFGRVETQLETHQPEEQHGFRGGRRVEEHLVTTRLVLDKLSNADVPIWIVRPGLVEGFRPSTLASTMARSFGTRPFRTYDLDDPKFISRPTGASCWQQWLQQVFWFLKWNTTRMRLKPPAFLFSVGNVGGE